MGAVFAVGAPGAQSTANGGKVTGFNNINNASGTIVAAANPSRQSITFHNPGANDTYVYPVTNAVGAPNAPTLAAPGGAFRVFGNGGSLTISGECQQQWAALNLIGSSQPLTVMESNVA